MVPHTYPTIEGRLVLGVITDITGLNEWQDYIPVVAQTNPVASSRNTFANDGYMGVNVLSSLTGLNAWIDYIPCYVVTGRSSPFSVSPDGYISVSAEVGTLGGASLADYIINSKTPDLVADFNGSLNTGTEFYDAGGTVDTFAELITHSRAGNATMTDGYGPELWTNPAQTLQGPWVSAGSGVYTIDGSQSGTVGVIDDDFVVIGKSYSITYTVSNRSAGGVTGQVGATSGNTNSSDGTYTDIVVATATNKPRVNANSSFIGTVSKISVREVPAIKWAPHNLLAYSEDFSNSYWEKGSCTESSGLLTATGVNAFLRRVISSTQHIQTFEAVVSSGTSAFPYMLLLPRSATDVSNQAIAYFNLNTGTVHSTQGTAISADIVALDSGEYKISLTVDTSASTSVQIEARLGFGNTLASQTTIIGNTLNVSKTNLYRSDLGGMVDNPETGDSYVPTTSSAVYLPRRNHHVYNGSAWVNEGVLHESEARTNLVVYSQNFTTGWLSGGQVTVVDNVAAAPDGTTTMDRLVVNTSNSAHSLYHGPMTITSGSNYTASIYIKNDGAGYAGISLHNSGSQFIAVVVDLSTGLITDTEVGSVSGTILDYGSEDVGNGIYRVWVSGSVANTAGYIIPFLSNVAAPTTWANGRPQYTGVLGEDILVWGAQLEAGSTPSSLIPTNGATVSRALETLTISAANMPWPEPNVIGDELVSNGDFSDGSTGWNLNPTQGTLEVVNGKLVATNASAFGSQAFTNLLSGYAIGTPYEISFTVSDYVSGTVQLSVGNTYSGGASSNGTFNFVVPYTSGLPRVYFNIGNTSLSIDNISVREIDPLAVSIQMQGRMTYADTGSTAEAYPYYWSLNGTNLILTDLYTLTDPDRLRFRQAASGVFDLVQDTSGNTFSPGINVPYNIASRHGSTFINGAVDGVALTANTTPTALPDLSATDFNLGYDYMGTISMLRVWADDLADVGIAEASEPSEVPSLQLTFDNSETSFTIQDWEQ
ncbi:hypothetical protein N9V70_01015 [Candidatus Pelagibacter bacterium]|nr:hypothetical protein [Candidatus Pelagibacter bacterium]